MQTTKGNIILRMATSLSPRSLSTAWAVLCLFAVCILCSCERRALTDEIGSLRLEINIDYDIKHSEGITEPEMMFVGMYSPEDGTLLRKEYTSAKGGQIFADPGNYDILVYNFDTEATIIRGNGDINTAEAYTNSAPTRISQEYKSIIHKINDRRPAPAMEKDYLNQPLINEPDYLFAGVDWDVDVPVRSNVDEIFVIHADAKTLVDTYRLTIGPITGMEYIASAEVFITGQVQSRLIASRKYTGEPATIYIPMDKSQSRSNELKAVFRTFGKYPGVDNKVYLVVKITDYDDNITLLEADVTDQFEDPENDDQEIIIEQEIEILPSSGGGGLQPSVSEWGDNITHIII